MGEEAAKAVAVFGDVGERFAQGQLCRGAGAVVDQPGADVGEFRGGDGSEDEGMEIRDIRPSDLEAIIEVHKIAFDGFFLTRMGTRFLRAYYQTALEFDGKIALVAAEPGTARVLGFAIGFREPQKFYEAFAGRRKQMLPAIVLAVLRDPGLVPQILRNMRRVEAQAQQPVNAVELSSIAVGRSGGGIGGLLLEGFIEAARAQGALRLTLTTDAEGNDNVRRFYETRGFILAATEMRGARTLCRYVRAIG